MEHGGNQMDVNPKSKVAFSFNMAPENLLHTQTQDLLTHNQNLVWQSYCLGCAVLQYCASAESFLVLLAGDYQAARHRDQFVITWFEASKLG